MTASTTATRPRRDDLRVLVIGAGTGGLCLAHGLRQRGVDVTVFERDRTRVLGPHGFWLGIDADGSRALHACLPPRSWETFVASCALPIRHFTLLTERMGQLLQLDVPPGDDPVSSEKSVNRSTMRQVLLTGLDDVVRFDKTFTGYRTNDDGTVTASFADGTTATGDVLVGADGTSSRVRRQYLPHAELEDTGLWGVTGKILLTDETRSLLPPDVLDGVSIFTAPRGIGCVFHTVDLPWDAEGRPKEWVEPAQAEVLRSWEELRYDPTRDYIMFGLAAARHWLPDDMLSWDGEALAGLVRRLTPRWHPNLRRLFELAQPESCFSLNIRTSVPIPAWAPTNVTLLGDAVHTMTPGRGVGANTALRDARLLARNLVAVRDGHLDLIEAIGAFEAEMRAYSAHAVERSRQRMNAQDPIHKPFVGRLALTGRRTGMRLVNLVGPVKRRMSEKEQHFRGVARDESVLAPVEEPAERRRADKSDAEPEPLSPNP
jgi:2-polyprenyl-6-methoxyphenol hydroxylase-like FAD-dependent oxidoreductase